MGLRPCRHTGTIDSNWGEGALKLLMITPVIVMFDVNAVRVIVCSFSGEAGEGFQLVLRDSVQPRLCPDNDAVVHHGRRGQRHLVERVRAKQLELRTGLDDVGVTVLTE